MKKLKGIITWIGLGAFLSLLFCGMYFCSLQAASGTTKCQQPEKNICVFFDVLIQKDMHSPTGLIHYYARGSP